MIKSTPHVHTDFVDGKAPAEQMVIAAIGRGMGSIGFSEHGIQPFDFAYCLSDQTERMYQVEIERLRERYKDQIQIYLGVERDRESSADRAAYQYVIGAMHYLKLGHEWIALDGAEDQVLRLLDGAFDGDGLRLAEAYYDGFAGYIEDYRPEIIAHFDLIRKNNRSGHCFDARDVRYQAIAKRALERMARTDALLEINTGAVARGYLREPYPELAMLRHWRELGGRVILSSDCHDPALIDCGFDGALGAARQAGFASAWALNPGDGALFVEYEI